jgi:hypothetical protein
MNTETYNIRFEYMQKHAPANAKHSTIEFNADNLEHNAESAIFYCMC